ncbi:MAG TPA: DUF4233 domain-containing protein [Streptosporangiaceae bacterium]|nr:DUF4233 domain-containing protein [Streptosporangiaceae bacterium]
MTYEKLLRRLCGTVLIMEAVILLLTIVPAIKFEHLNGGAAGGLGAGLAVAGLVLGGMVGRPGMGWALVAGTVFQAAVIASGAFIPVMYGLGGVFGALWITGIWLARRIVTQIAANQAAVQQAAAARQPAHP